MALRRHAWLDFSVSFLDDTKLRLTVVSSVREAVVELPMVRQKKQRPQRMEQASELLLFSLHMPEAAVLKPSSGEELHRRLEAQPGLRQVEVNPDTVTLKYEFGPMYLFVGGPRTSDYRGFGIDRRLSPRALEQTVQQAYRALLDLTDARVLV